MRVQEYVVRERGAMAHRVRIFLRHGDQMTGRYIGERDLQEAPRLEGHIAFEHQGRMKTGKVERIAPTDWRPDTALIPSVHVIEEALKGEKAPPERG
jgi:hypothetical protein